MSQNPLIFVNGSIFLSRFMSKLIVSGLYRITPPPMSLK